MSAPAPRSAFELRVLPLPADSYGLEVWQKALASDGRGDRTNLRVAHASEVPLRAVIEQVLATLGRAGYRASDLRRGRHEPFRLSEEDGVRLALVFLAIHPLHKLARIEAVSSGIRAMAAEELYYWFSLATAAASGRRTLKALRLMLADE